MLGWWIVHTIVLPVSTTFRIVVMMIAEALASRPVVGSSMNTMEGLATSSTAIVSLFRCPVDRPFTPGKPTSTSPKGRSLAEKSKDSYTVMWGEWMSFCSHTSAFSHHVITCGMSTEYLTSLNTIEWGSNGKIIARWFVLSIPPAALLLSDSAEITT
nr:hypothetical protein AXF42_Ash020690 [Ipomoea trifida]